MKRISKYYFIYYHKRKYAIVEADLNYMTYGFRRVFPDVICCVVDSKLNARDKQLVIHKLITGRKLYRGYGHDRIKKCI